MAQRDLQFPGIKNIYHGKVRDVYTLENGLLVMAVSNRISAFDVILPKEIPYKGQVLNQLASSFLDKTEDIAPNWKIATPDPQITIGYACEPFKIEMVIRGYLTGHAWRTYKSGQRVLCGVEMPEGMKEHDKFPEPIITPATKAEEGHDEDISREDIIAKGIVEEKDYRQIEACTRALFERGTEIAAERGLILVDTKYEFGRASDGRIMLIDEIHTPDSSRYFYAEGYEERQANGEAQMQLSKEFVREWLIENGFMGQEGQQVPPMSDEYVNRVSERYVELYQKLSGETFEAAQSENPSERMEQNIVAFLENYKAK